MKFVKMSLITRKGPILTEFSITLEQFPIHLLLKPPDKTIHFQKKHTAWLTKGLRTSINHKRGLYLRCKSSNNQKLKDYYKLYCKILSKLIKQAKCLQCSKTIAISNNKPKTLWNIIESETGKSKRREQISLLHNKGTLTQDPLTVANHFSDYFSTIADNLIHTIQTSIRMQSTNASPLPDVLYSQHHSYPA